MIIIIIIKGKHKRKKRKTTNWLTQSSWSSSRSNLEPRYTPPLFIPVKVPKFFCYSFNSEEWLRGSHDMRFIFPQSPSQKNDELCQLTNKKTTPATQRNALSAFVCQPNFPPFRKNYKHTRVFSVRKIPRLFCQLPFLANHALPRGT